LTATRDGVRSPPTERAAGPGPCATGPPDLARGLSRFHRSTRNLAKPASCPPRQRHRTTVPGGDRAAGDAGHGRTGSAVASAGKATSPSQVGAMTSRAWVRIPGIARRIGEIHVFERQEKIPTRAVACARVPELPRGIGLTRFFSAPARWRAPAVLHGQGRSRVPVVDPAAMAWLSATTSAEPASRRRMAVKLFGDGRRAGPPAPASWTALSSADDLRPRFGLEPA
jgi:hypothetical protein